MIHAARHLVRVWLLCAAAFCLTPTTGRSAPAEDPAVGPARNTPDAFLPLPAANVESVLEQVQSDPAVRRHYAGYLHLPQARVASYLRANLVRSRLRQGGLYTVYLVRANGLIYPTIQTLPAGSAVFALRNGVPLLTCREGNPLTRTQKAVRLGAKPRPAPPLTPAPPAPPVQVIVPTAVQTTVVPPLTAPTDAVPTEAPAPVGPAAAK